ncbi:hypothetical protein, partial [Rhodopirellula bahusiensis]
MTIQRTMGNAAKPDDIKNLQRARRSPTWFSRAALTDLASLDADARTIDATIATENAVTFYDWQQRRPMQEVLVGSGGRLSKWVPLLDSHASWHLTNSLGSVLNSKLVGTDIKAQLQFAAEPDVDPIWGRVRDGHLRMVSIGGRRIKFTDIEPGQTAEILGRRWTAGSKFPLRVTTQWIQREASI